MEKLNGIQRIYFATCAFVFFLTYYIGPYWSLYYEKNSNWRILDNLVMEVHLPIIHTYKAIFNIEGMLPYAEVRFFWAVSTTIFIAVLLFFAYSICEWIYEGFNKDK